MRIHLILQICLLVAATTPPLAAQDGKPDARVMEDIPQDRQDTALKAGHAAEALQKAGILAVISSVSCSKPTLRYNTVPLSDPSENQSIVQESEIWYFHCPEISPVLVHYWRKKDGEISKIHVHEFGTFMHDLPVRKLASRRNAKASFKDFPKRTALHEAVCFGMLSEELATSLSRRVPRLSMPSKTREDRQVCLRMQACNSIEPELDVLQDISLAETDDRQEWAGFVEWCNGKDMRILISEEPELAYGLMQLLPRIPELTEQRMKSGDGRQRK